LSADGAAIVWQVVAISAKTPKEWE
jgi:hypothetical protein